jgi:hypothetical protein
MEGWRSLWNRGNRNRVAGCGLDSTGIGISNELTCIKQFNFWYHERKVKVKWLSILSPRKNSGTHWTRRWVGPRATLEVSGKGTIIFLSEIRTPNRPACSLITALTVLSRLPYKEGIWQMNVWLKLPEREYLQCGNSCHGICVERQKFKESHDFTMAVCSVEARTGHLPHTSQAHCWAVPK